MKDWLMRVLKVPPEPSLPPGSRESVQVFRAGENYYRLLLLQWFFKQISAVVGIIVSLMFLREVSFTWAPEARVWAQAAEWVGVGGFLIQLPFTFVMVRLNYELRWYVVTDRSLRIRWGLIHIREMTMTFANIQHLAVHQGPLQRWLGLYDLQVRTAGGGSGGDDPREMRGAAATHLGYFRGVDNAPAIRDLIAKRMKHAHDAGLGNPDDVREAPAEMPARLDEFHAAVAEVRQEIRALREFAAPAAPATS